MVIAHNLSAMNVQRQFNITIRGVKKSTEKLSSGYRINRSADDAAGLSISEKMRNQIRGLNQACNNIEDGISLIQTADGALSEVHNILHRIGELSVKSANDTNAEEDRSIINDEVIQLKKEIEDIFEKTEFNGKGLFTTSKLTAGFIGVGGTPGLRISVGGQNRGPLKVIDSGMVVEDASYYFASTWNVIDDGAGNYKFSFSLFDKETGDMVSNLIDSISKVDFREACEKGKYCNLTLEDELHTDPIMPPNSTYIQIGFERDMFRPSQADLKTINPTQYEAELDAYQLSKVEAIKNANIYMMDDLHYYCGTMDSPIMKDMVLQTGANAGNITEMNWKSLNLDVIGMQNTNVLTHLDSQNAIGEVQRAIKIVSAERSNFGAIQNRLEKTLNNNQNYAENLQSAESQIRDTDMANEVLINTKHNILQQVSQAMLAQANQNNQSVLSLIQ